MTTNITNSQAPEILAKQVAEWRKEVARLNDLIAHAEGRDSQAASIDTPEFDDLLLTYWECRNQGESYAANERAELIAYIDAKLAQARDDGRRDSHETNVTMLNLKLKAEDRAAIAEDAWRAEKKRADKAEEWQETEKEFSHSMEQRARVAESRLAEIQRGVEGLVRFDDHDSGLEISLEAGRFVFRHEVLALLQPQGQADTSGLPG